MGCNHGKTSTPESPAKTLLEGAKQTGDAAKLSMVTNVGGASHTLNSFIPLIEPGIFIGYGNDARAVCLESATLDGQWIAHGPQDAILVAKTESPRCRDTVVGGVVGSASSKRWLAVAENDGYVKTVELNVTSRNGELCVQAAAASHLWPATRASNKSIEIEELVNKVADNMSAAPVATSSTALGYGVASLMYTVQEHVKGDADKVFAKTIDSIFVEAAERMESDASKTMSVADEAGEEEMDKSNAGAIPAAIEQSAAPERPCDSPALAKEEKAPEPEHQLRSESATVSPAQADQAQLTETVVLSSPASKAEETNPVAPHMETSPKTPAPVVPIEESKREPEERLKSSDSPKPKSVTERKQRQSCCC